MVLKRQEMNTPSKVPTFDVLFCWRTSVADHSNYLVNGSSISVTTIIHLSDFNLCSIEYVIYFTLEPEKHDFALRL